ncbi:MAG: hypothetical protein NVSMB47_15090 [Polyangiales bacterium]
MAADPSGGDRTIPRVAMAIAVCALVFAGASWAAFGLRFGLGVAVGGAIGATNFLVLARVGKAMTQKDRDAWIWGGVYLLKVFALFGGVAYLLHTRAVNGLGLIVGFAAIVPGIVVGGLLAAPTIPTGPVDDLPPATGPDAPAAPKNAADREP